MTYTYIVAMRVFPLFLVLLSGCSAAVSSSESTEDDLSQTTYVGTSAYFKTAKDQLAWAAVKDKIRREFDNVCGDTFCSGDYSNLTSMDFVCSVTSARGSIQECAWVFTGSSHLVNSSTGTIQASVASFQCRFHPTTSARTLLNTLYNAKEAIRVTLPGENRSIYDVLGDCFQNPIGATPLTFGTGNTYVDALDAQTTNQDQWIGMWGSLASDFASECANGLCKGRDIRHLRFVCSVRDTTNTLRSCKWLFADASMNVDAKTGALGITSTPYRCTIPATGKANDLSALLTQSDPIDRTLPGQTTSARDALVKCF